MEIYTSNDKKITAIVDYAHNQLSFQKLFESVRNEYPGYRVTIISVSYTHLDVYKRQG